MCRLLEVSRSGFYAWLRREEGEASPRALENRRLTERIKAIHAKSRETYGSPRIHAELRKSGDECGKNRVARLMSQAGIRSKVRKKFRVKTTDSNHAYPIAPNLLRDHAAPVLPNEIWVADITYIPTAEGWLYLASILDLCSRKVVGWAMKDNMRVELTLEALEMALKRRRPGTGLLHHSDRGTQYAAGDYRDRLDEHGLVPSMSRKGNCYDNAAKESFFHTLKTELVHQTRYRTREEAKTSLFEYIEVFYNRQRLHSSLGYRSPEEFEALLEATTATEAA